ncbi:hypothetical protein BDY19DRAFT_949955 [Irpex rosettiformis]|uniref:Uncharacterized protein n=1 Tax=Irpex rosettiformis TaxID=378272 RepID=A0ACB8U1L9_9APHY|nr:hypothetical protein BDY19DRAFT_949955 [Irpex rosettiformis]
MFTAIVTLALLAPSALANLAFTQPVATSSWAPGQNVNIVWQDDSNSPKLTDLGTGSFGIFVGGTTTQAQLVHITDSVNVATTSQINFQVPDGFGPSYTGYFVRFTSDSCVDKSTSLNFPCEAFSAKFAINNLSGSFNSTIQQIADNGSSSSQSAGASASVGTTTGGASSAASTPAASATSHASSSGSAHSSSASAKATGASSANSAAGVFASTGLVAVAAAFAGSMML